MGTNTLNNYDPNSIQVTWNGIKIDGFVLDEDITLYLKQPKYKKVIETLGNIKGKISKEDEELLRIVHHWNDNELNEAIKEYKEIYNKYIKEIKPYGKELWR